MPSYHVNASFDVEALVWYVEETDVPGLSTEAATFEEFCRKVDGAGTAAGK